MRDIKNRTAIVHLLDAASISATTSSSILDTAKFESNLILINLGAFAAADGSNYYTITLQESATTVGTDFTSVSASDYAVSGTLLVNSTSLDQTTIIFQYKGTKRYVRATLTKTGTVSGPCSVVGVLGHGVQNPPSSVSAITAS